MTTEIVKHNRTQERPADRNKERESVSRVINILWDNFSFISTISETDKWSVADKNGVDLVLELKPEAAEPFGFSQIKIQVKSSEIMIQAFFEKGQQIERQYGYNWREPKLIILNGQADERFIIADFIAQLINILEAIGKDSAVNDLISLLSEQVYEIYEDEVYPEQVERIMEETYEALRGPILAWVKHLAEE